ncbi:(d)CMP kinase [Coprobacter secundus]|uniref:Cytidylate kinase n=1 Tax=Coprobacter secundus subsp. similis TaxID=2751153 RepID=A0A7G1HXC3_9BACT|nr:(d)CMP kinase [Coprobacter secundus]KHM48704.1 cytidylate kinase [Coprobacter secundus]BCI63462.1 cytidylate kinase [Coprobacter secundus subsp. similis]CCY36385.1 cytidylate kinase [Tannerella sp. CAG:118]
MKQNNKIVIAIDGFSSCGKSTMAKGLAKRIGYIYIDSGAMYRAVTLYCINHNLIDGNLIDENSLKKQMQNIHIEFKINTQSGRPETWLNGKNVEQEIRSMQVSNLVSPVSALKFVRTAMTTQQQALGKAKGIVMDGRDIGTTVFPHAELKIFVTASAETRAKRRLDELKAKGENISYQEVLKNVQERDYIDQNRSESPLKKADDAILLDNSDMTLEEQDKWLYEQYQKALFK